MRMAAAGCPSFLYYHKSKKNFFFLAWYKKSSVKKDALLPGDESVDAPLSSCLLLSRLLRCFSYLEGRPYKCEPSFRPQADSDADRDLPA